MKEVGKRIVWPERGKVAIEDFEVRQPEPKEVLIKTVITLISSGTEMAFLMSLPNTPNKFPQYPGYSNAGKVIAVGKKVNDIRVDDRVVSMGPHASHVLISENQVQLIPSDLSFDEATFSTLSSVALQGIRKARIELGDSVLILGQGLVGQLALQLAKLSGALPLIAVDLYDSRLHISSRNGADYRLNPEKVDLEEEVKRITGGKGTNVVIDTTGNPEVIPLSFELTSRAGRVILLGSPRGESKVNFYSQVHRKGISVIGAHNFVRPKYESFHGWWTQRDDNELILKLLNKSMLKVRDLVSLKVNFQKAPEVYKKILESRKEILGPLLQWDIEMA